MPREKLTSFIMSISSDCRATKPPPSQRSHFTKGNVSGVYFIRWREFIWFIKISQHLVCFSFAMLFTALAIGNAMTKKTTTYVVQYENVFKPGTWTDFLSSYTKSQRKKIFDMVRKNNGFYWQSRFRLITRTTTTVDVVEK